MPDGQLAKVLGRPRASVRNRRLRLGIELENRVRRDWTPEEDALLGRYSDSEVARRLNRTYKSVQGRRLALKIVSANHKFANWTAEEDGWFGVVADRVITKRTERSLRAVKQRKRVLFPEKYPPRKPAAPRWSQKEIQLLGTMPDRQLANKLGRTYRSVEKKRRQLGIAVVPRRRFDWTADKRKMLLKHSDRELARMWQCSALTLRRQRRLLRIAPTKQDIPWTPQEDRLLWRFDNESVALRTGRSVSAAAERRQYINAPPSGELPSWKPRKPARRKKRLARRGN